MSELQSQDVLLPRSSFHFCPYIMKQILLSVPGVRSEMGGGEAMRAAKADSAPRKIKLAQTPHDPNVHREGSLHPVSKEQHAIGHFSADAGQFHEFSSGEVCGQLMQ